MGVPAIHSTFLQSPLKTKSNQNDTLELTRNMQIYPCCPGRRVFPFLQFSLLSHPIPLYILSAGTCLTICWDLSHRRSGLVPSSVGTCLTVCRDLSHRLLGIVPSDERIISFYLGSSALFCWINCLGLPPPK